MEVYPCHEMNLKDSNNSVCSKLQSSSSNTLIVQSLKLF